MLLINPHKTTELNYYFQFSLNWPTSLQLLEVTSHATPVAQSTA